MIGEKLLKNLYPEFENDVQQNGIDLRCGKIYEFLDTEDIGLYKNIKKLPKLKNLYKYKKTLPDGNVCQGYYLKPGVSYSIVIDRVMKIPNGFSQLYYPRSTLNRSNISLFTAVGDSGFEGMLQFKIRNDGDVDFFLGENERFCQMVCFRVEGECSNYNGSYQQSL